MLYYSALELNAIISACRYKNHRHKIYARARDEKKQEQIEKLQAIDQSFQ